MPVDIVPLSWWETKEGPVIGARLDTEYIESELRKIPMSRSELALKAVRDDGKPLSKQMVSDLLNGKRGASPSTVRALAAALDVLPRKLLRDVVSAPQSAPVTTGSAA